MKKIYRNFTVLLILLASACNLDGDLQNPNEITVAGADVNLLMNAVQLDFANYIRNKIVVEKIVQPRVIYKLVLSKRIITHLIEYLTVPLKVIWIIWCCLYINCNILIINNRG